MKMRMVKSINFLIPIIIISCIKISFHLPYKQTEGIIKATVRKSILEDKHPIPGYSQICRRTNKLDIDIHSSIDDDEDDDNVIIIAADGPGIKRLQTEVNEFKINGI